MPGLGGASAGSPPIHDGMSAIGLLPVLHPAIRLATAKSKMRLGFIVSAPVDGQLGVAEPPWQNTCRDFQ